MKSPAIVAGLPFVTLPVAVAGLGLLAWLGTLAGLLIAALLLLTRLLAAALLTGLLPRLIALLLLARLLVGILILTHYAFLHTFVGFVAEDDPRDSPANKITSGETFRSVCNGSRELPALM